VAVPGCFIATVLGLLIYPWPIPQLQRGLLSDNCGNFAGTQIGEMPLPITETYQNLPHFTRLLRNRDAM
jgi:hypothetical protein